MSTARVYRPEPPEPLRPRTLILVPTNGELERLQASVRGRNRSRRFALCGFGPVAAACRTMQWLCSEPFDHVVLCGAAGTYIDTLRIGDVVTFRSVSLDGVGVVESGHLRTGSDLGFDTSVPNVLQGLLPHPRTHCEDTLLTVCLGAATPEQAAQRAQDFAASAEDMEGFGVALACRERHVPLTILRGISNVAGDRDKRHWRLGDALDAVGRLL